MQQKIYFILGFVLVLLSSVFFYSFRTAKQPTEVVDTVDVNIEFGRGPNCISRGTCSITESTDSREGEVPEGRGRIYFDQESRLVLEIAKASMEEGVLNEQFAEKLLEFNKDLDLPQEIFQKLRRPNLVRSHAKIQAGKYEVEEDDTYFKVIVH